MKIEASMYVAFLKYQLNSVFVDFFIQLKPLNCDEYIPKYFPN